MVTDHDYDALSDVDRRARRQSRKHNGQSTFERLDGKNRREPLSKIKLYIEGGGDSALQDTLFREMVDFFSKSRIGWALR